MFVFAAIRRRRRRRKEKELQQRRISSSRPSVRVTSDHNSNNTPLGLEDIEQNMPFLYSLARSWAWDAVTYRCRTHPEECGAQGK